MRNTWIFNKILKSIVFWTIIIAIISFGIPMWIAMISTPLIVLWFGPAAVSLLIFQGAWLLILAEKEII